MPNSKELFLDRIKYLNKSFSIERLIDLPPSNSEHNNIAKILRNGMAVIGFVSLEDFIKKRTSEALIEIGSYSVAFNDLPLDIRYKTTVDILSSLIRLAKFEVTKQDKITFVQNYTAKISSTLNSTYDLAEIAFGHNASNLDALEIKTILKSFNVQDAWRQMSDISSRIGLTAFPLENSFKNAAIRRHSAAHEAFANTPLNDLIQFIKEALGIAISFDSIISKALNYLKNHDLNYMSGSKNIISGDIRLSTIKIENNQWKYKLEGGTRSIKNEIDKTVLLSFAIGKASLNNETLIIFDQFNNIENWYSYY